LGTLGREIQEIVTSYRKDIAELTQALVRIPTENPPGRHYRACAELLARSTRDLGFSAQMREIRPPKNSARHAGKTRAAEPRYLVCASHGAGPRALYFHGHYDVVPAASPAQFHPHQRNGSIFGRGSGDMKGGLAAMLYAVRALKDLKIKLNGRIELRFVPDEETGGQRGTGALFDNPAFARDAIGMLTAEPTGGEIWNACRGAISLRVTIRGKPAHVGLSVRGVNAFEHMLEVASALKTEKTRIARRKTSFRIEPEAARKSILLIGGEVAGGTNFNVVPAQCVFTVDRRINPEENLAVEKQRLLAILERMRRKGVQLEVEILQEGFPAAVRESEALAQALAQSVHAITSRHAAFRMCPGLLETRFYSARGIPALAYGPGRLSVAHGPNEFVSIAELAKCAAVYALTAIRLLASKGISRRADE
jgi:acetylornithine deacetylase/succinyl-diaminopimelate desuccinylase family protein